MKIYNRNGLFVEADARIALDGCAGDTCFVSHAHSDHSAALKRKNKRIIASRETIALCGAAHESVSHDGMRLLRSGHMLGAAQLRIENGCCFAYTGDFKTEDSLTAKGAEQAQCDTLLMESTYGKPQYVFPPRDDVYRDIAGWVSKNHAAGRIVLLGGYALGKAQELVALLNEYCGIAPLVSDRIERGCGVYECFGVHLERIALGSREAEGELKRSFVAVVPQHLANTTLAQKLGAAHGREVLCATASGWALGGCGGAHQAFPLSDHADFNQLLQYAEQSGAKRIYTCHGFAAELAHELRKRGMNASPVGEAQSTLCEF